MFFDRHIFCYILLFGNVKDDIRQKGRVCLRMTCELLKIKVFIYSLFTNEYEWMNEGMHLKQIEQKCDYLCVYFNSQMHNDIF